MERAFEHVVRWGPYVLLALGTLLSVLGADTWEERFITLGLVAIAAAWVYGFFGIGPNPDPADRPWRHRVYFLGLLALAFVLMQRDSVFFVFTITGFFHAYLLRPGSAIFIGVGATSLVINSMIVVDNPTTDGWATFGLIVVIQTVAIGLGLLGGEKISELSEQRRLAVADLERVVEENAGLHAQLVDQAREAGVLDERQRMAREIHDTLAQGLAGVITQLEAADQALSRTAELRRHLDVAARLARDTLSEARRSVADLVPTPLDGARLPDALSEVGRRWSETTGVAINVATTGDVFPLPPDIEVALLRVTQEALANVGRHAGATRTGVTLSFMDEMVSLDVRDDGDGFDPGRNGGPKGFGLGGMRQRVSDLQGTFSIESAPGEGTAISVAIPVPQEASDA